MEPLDVLAGAEVRAEEEVVLPLVDADGPAEVAALELRRRRRRDGWDGRGGDPRWRAEWGGGFKRDPDDS